MSASYSPLERQYYDRLFTVIDKEDAGVIPGQDALPFLVSSGLPQQKLGEVWALADPDNNGFLTKDGWYRAARLIGWLQKGNQSSADEALIEKAGPLPTFAGQPPPPIPNTTLPAASPSVASLPPLTSADRTKFTRIFVGCGPQNGLVSGDKARDVFVKSQLNYDKLGQIWNLADTQQRGSLDLTDFIIGMYLIQSCMANPSLSLPTTLPPDTYSQASGGRPAPISPVTPQRTGNSLRGPASPLQPQRTGTPPRPPVQTPWLVTPEAKATSDRFFAQLDPQNKGTIEGDVAVPFMVQSQLDEGTLASIWDLADIRHEGRLDRDQFAVAMHLINTKLSGQEIPATLPTALIPPALRDIAGQQEVLSGPASATKDLFDLFDDTPAPAPVPPASLPLPPSRRGTGPINERGGGRSPSLTGAFSNARSLPPVASPSSLSGVEAAPGDDLLGDDSTPVPTTSASLGNIQNQLSNTTRALTDLTKTREDLEKAAASSSDQLAELESKLSAAKVKHEAETKAVSDLRSKVAEQATRLKQLQGEVITAESDVSALRSEKDELEQAFLHDKEEVRGLQKRMKEVEDEKGTLRNVLEKLRKEARQQKGMVTIAKKQLSTAESSRDAIQKDIDDEAATPVPDNVPLPATPQALSPALTGVSQRSNNPFERLRDTSAGTNKAPTQTSAPTNFDTAFADFHQPVISRDVVTANPPESDDLSGTESNEIPEESAIKETIPPIENTASGLDTSPAPYQDTAPVYSSQPVEVSVPQPQHEAMLTSPNADKDSEVEPQSAREDQQAAPSGDQAVQIGDGSSIVSSDEDEGPEDLENTSRSFPKPTLAEPIIASSPAGRRSAPAPPSRAPELDPFGAPEPESVVEPAAPATSGPLETNFDEDDFDFSDLPPAHINPDNEASPPSQPAATAFDDEFSGFDDEFGSSQVNTGSDVSNSISKSYEIVPPQPSKPYDEWGFGKSTTPAPTAPQSAFSFDDAFGGDFETPAVPAAAAVSSTDSAPTTSLTTPALPQRRESQPQNDDIEDVKKLCAMGFSRSLVVEALDANGYDFQKTLNVLLTQ